MQKYFLFTILFSVSMACNDKTAQQNQETEMANQVSAIDQIVGIGKITPENDIIQLSSPVSGVVQKVYKKENDTVNAGTIILELEHSLEDENIIQLGNQVTTQAAQIEVDQASVNEYVAKKNNAKSELQSLENLLSKGAETQQTLDDAATNLKTLTSNVNKLQAAVTVSKSKLQESKTALKTAQLQNDQKIIRSPINGRILELTVLIGGSVSIQESFAQISPEGRMIAICEIDEANATKIEVGQKGWIRNVGATDTLSTGTVYFVFSFLNKKSLFTDQSGEKEDRRVCTIKMMLDAPENLLLNKRVECVIDIPNNLKE